MNTNEIENPFDDYDVTFGNDCIATVEYDYDVKAEYDYLVTGEKVPVVKQRVEVKNERFEGKTELCNIAKIATMQDTLLPDFIFEELPNVLKKGADYFDSKTQRDLFLTGALGVISGCFSNVYGEYHNDELAPNLFTFITAPAASGKGALKYARTLGEQYHSFIKAQNNNEKDEEKTAKKILFIPGNTSAAALISHLEVNSGNGVFFETEADTLSNTFKQEWGNFSDLLRKAFHNEPVSLSRKGNYEFIEINKPKLAVVLSGTPNQVGRLIPSVEDGLFSRFIFYSFGSDPVWEDVKPNGKKLRASQHFNDLSLEFFDIISSTSKYEEIKFSFTEEQFNILNDVQEKSLRFHTDKNGPEIASIVMRHGAIWFKIAMNLTVLKQYEKLNENNLELVCDDIDFLTAQLLVEIYTQHAIDVYNMLKGNINNDEDISEKCIELFNKLPEGNFKRKDIISLKDILNVSERSIDNYLAELKKKGKIKNIDFYNMLKNI